MENNQTTHCYANLHGQTYHLTKEQLDTIIQVDAERRTSDYIESSAYAEKVLKIMSVIGMEPEANVWLASLDKLRNFKKLSLFEACTLVDRMEHYEEENAVTLEEAENWKPFEQLADRAMDIRLSHSINHEKRNHISIWHGEGTTEIQTAYEYDGSELTIEQGREWFYKLQQSVDQPIKEITFSCTTRLLDDPGYCLTKWYRYVRIGIGEGERFFGYRNNRMVYDSFDSHRQFLTFKFRNIHGTEFTLPYSAMITLIQLDETAPEKVCTAMSMIGMELEANHWKNSMTFLKMAINERNRHEEYVKRLPKGEFSEDRTYQEKLEDIANLKKIHKTRYEPIQQMIDQARTLCGMKLYPRY